MTPNRINDAERELWVVNDEYLYRKLRAFRGSKRKFLKENREEIDAIIKATLAKEPR